jgi:hypothetical protein
MIGRYILRGHVAVQEPDLLTWAQWLGSSMAERRVAEQSIGQSRVSTVFLGLDHCFGDGPPLLFETMVFGGPLDGEQARCTAWAEAEVMHAAMVDRVKEATMLTVAPPLGTRVVVMVPGHERVGQHGSVVCYHGRLEDCVYVLFDGTAESELIALPYLDLEKSGAA